jgi:hypothetical protein
MFKWSRTSRDEDPIPRLLNLKLQRQRFYFKTHWATHGDINFYNGLGPGLENILKSRVSISQSWEWLNE